jgi:hypothetical protein
MQSSCLRLMGKKLLVSLAMEGKFSREGLQSLDEDDDMLTAMARELVTENGVGEIAAAVWRQIQEENGSILNPANGPSEPTPVVEHEPITASLLRPVLTVERAVEAPKFGTRTPLARPLTRRRESPPRICNSRSSDVRGSSQTTATSERQRAVAPCVAKL